MNWRSWLIVGAFILLLLLVKKLAFVSRAKAHEMLTAGGVVVDVRTDAEFRKEHLPGVLNIPLDRLGEEIDSRVPDRNRPILLHCLSGSRSGIGRSLLKRKGYFHVVNLGSYRRAAKIIGGR